MTAFQKIKTFFSKKSFSNFRIKSSIYSPLIKLEVPNFLNIQRLSFQSFLNQGLLTEFEKYRSISNSNRTLEIFFYVKKYKLQRPKWTPKQAILKKKSYLCELYIPVQLSNRITKEVELQWVYVANLPLMTKHGHFIINGCPRVLMNQKVRSPGIYFKKIDKALKKTFYCADFIAQRGSWLRLEVDNKKGDIWVKLKRTPKIPILLFLKTLGLNPDLFKQCVDWNKLQSLFPLQGMVKTPGPFKTPHPFFFKNYSNTTLNNSIKASKLKLFFRKFDLEKPTFSFFEKGPLFLWNEDPFPDYFQSLVELSQHIFPFEFANMQTNPKFAHLRKKFSQVAEEMPEEQLLSKTQETQSFKDESKNWEKSENPRSENSIDPLSMKEVKNPFDELYPKPTLGESKNRFEGGEKSGEILGENQDSNLFFKKKLAEESKKESLEKMDPQIERGLEVELSFLTELRLKQQEELQEKAQALLKSPFINLVLNETKKTRTLFDPLEEQESFLMELEQKLKPLTQAEQFLFQKFQNKRTYDLSFLGRSRINQRLGLSIDSKYTLLTAQDVFAACLSLLDFLQGLNVGDDIDDLKNRQINPSGELMQTQLATGLAQYESLIIAKIQPLGSDYFAAFPGAENLREVFVKLFSFTPLNPINQCFKDFFARSPLSQLMDQTNALAELTHKRRLSSLGPGGINRETAGMDIRGIHPTHYGRICPIETPEGKNAGLVNSLTIYAYLNENRLIETPFYKTHKGLVLKNQKPLLFSSEQEKNWVFAPGDITLSFFNFLPPKVLIPSRQSLDFKSFYRENIHYTSPSPLQMISVATSLIPFLEHDDGNRALMGSNMQRQGVATLRPAKPIVGTGLESRVVADVGQGLQAEQSGFIAYVDGKNIFLYSQKSHPKLGEKLGLLHEKAFFFENQATANFFRTPFLSNAKLRTKKSFQNEKNKNLFPLKMGLGDRPFSNRRKKGDSFFQPRLLNQFSKFFLRQQRKRASSASVAALLTKKGPNQAFLCYPFCYTQNGKKISDFLIFSSSTLETPKCGFFCSPDKQAFFFFYKHLFKNDLSGHFELLTFFYKKFPWKNSLKKSKAFFAKRSFLFFSQLAHQKLLFFYCHHLFTPPYLIFPVKVWPTLSYEKEKTRRKGLGEVFLNFSKKGTQSFSQNPGPGKKKALIFSLPLTFGRKKARGLGKFISWISAENFFGQNFFFSCLINLKNLSGILRKMRFSLSKGKKFAKYANLREKKSTQRSGLKEIFNFFQSVSPLFFYDPKSAFTKFLLTDLGERIYTKRLRKKRKSKKKFFLSNLPGKKVSKNFLKFFLKFPTPISPPYLRVCKYANLREQGEVLWPKKSKVDYNFVRDPFSRRFAYFANFFLKKALFLKPPKKKIFSGTKLKKKKPLFPRALFLQKERAKFKDKFFFPPEKKTPKKGGKACFLPYYPLVKFHFYFPKVGLNVNFSLGKLFFSLLKTTFFPIFQTRKDKSKLCQKPKRVKKVLLKGFEKRSKKGPFSLVESRVSLILSSYNLNNYHRSNQDTYNLHRPVVQEGQWVEKGDLLADSSSSSMGELSLGQNLFVGYTPWEGYNFEDAVLISEKVLSEDLYTSLHIERYEVDICDTDFGPEQLTKQIPNTQIFYDYLDETGLPKIGAWVDEGDILVGKVAPLAPQESNPYEAFLWDLLKISKEIPQTRDTSFRVPKGERGRILHVEIREAKTPVPLFPLPFSNPQKRENRLPFYKVKKGAKKKSLPRLLFKTKKKYLPQLYPFFFQKGFEKKKGFETGGFLKSLAKKELPLDSRSRAFYTPFFKKAPQVFCPANFSLIKNKKSVFLKKISFSGFADKKRKIYQSMLNKRKKKSAFIFYPKPTLLGKVFNLSHQLRKYKVQGSLSSFSWFADFSSVSLPKRKLFLSRPSQVFLPRKSFQNPKDPKGFSKKKSGGFPKGKRFAYLQTFSKTLTLSKPPLIKTPTKFSREKTPLLFKNPKKVWVYLAVKRKLQVGDKVAGRHGNKGIISNILPRQDMPYLPDGTPLDIVLNPLGVPSRMNVGQIFECLLGLAGYYLKQNYKIQPFDEIYGCEASRSLVYSKLYEARIKTGQNWLFNPDFPGKTRLFDGRTGDCFEQPVTVGVAYILKLIHLVDEKIHARLIGPYSLVTQQPLRGRSKQGGQRVGEMEVWALEGFGAAYSLQELLTVKSDDLKGRQQLLKSLLLNKPLAFGFPESFKVLVRELQALCLDISIYKNRKKGGRQIPNKTNTNNLEKL